MPRKEERDSQSPPQNSIVMKWKYEGPVHYVGCECVKTVSVGYVEFTIPDSQISIPVDLNPEEKLQPCHFPFYSDCIKTVTTWMTDANAEKFTTDTLIPTVIANAKSCTHGNNPKLETSMDIHEQAEFEYNFYLYKNKENFHYLCCMTFSDSEEMVHKGVSFDKSDCTAKPSNQMSSISSVKQVVENQWEQMKTNMTIVGREYDFCATCDHERWAIQKCAHHELLKHQKDPGEKPSLSNW